MIHRPQRGDPLWIWTLVWWDLASWALLALLVLLTLAGDVPTAGERYGSLALMVVLGLSYAALRRYPGNRVMGPNRYLALLALTLGTLHLLRSGFGILYLVMLPQYAIVARGPRAAIPFSALTAAAITAGGYLREGDTLGDLGQEALSPAAGLAASLVITLVTPRALALQAERAQLRADLAAAQLQLAEAQRRQGAAEERERLAREIHDTLAQGFASIIVLAEAARARLTTAPEACSQQLRSIEQTARENLAEARVLVGSAPRDGVAPGSVARTLRRTLDRFIEDTGLAVEAELADIACDQPTRIALLRCTQESLANIRKHARATTVGVVLSPHPDGVELEITDDGRGFVVGESKGFGLDGMRRRLAELGGELTVTSSVGDGTRVLAMIPTDSEAEVSHA
ncbi:sensor histidine kinase [Streptomyces sp. 6N223]|uniref:sensor histidine kinase n=1 Tax=Streptomyces sp. 6N223 TaxID=3457412 RepID=UPI003FCFFE12